MAKGKALDIQRENDNQLIISLLFLGMAVGQMIYGPLSDSLSRKPAIYAGFGLFILVPVIAPLLGQTILIVAYWRAIFGVYLVLALIAFLWFAVRQLEWVALSPLQPF